MLTARQLRIASFSIITSLFLLLVYKQQNFAASGAGRQHLRDYDHQDQHLLSKERLCHPTAQFGGYVLNEKGTSSEIKSPITVCLVHEFSPYVEQEAEKRFVDPARDNVYFANSPATVWYKGEIVMVARIWLQREKYEKHKDWPSNHYADNYLYTQKFDAHMKPTSAGRIMGIPMGKQWWVGDGPIEPRLFIHADKLYVTFNGAMSFDHKHSMDYTVMWDYNENKVIIPRIQGGSPMINATEKDDMPRDKHWSAFEDSGELFFVHNLDPLRIMKCSVAGLCTFIHSETNAKGFIFHHWTSHLRGGSPFVQYKYPYYLTVAHATMYKKSNNHRFYTAHFVLMCVSPDHRLVYMSDQIDIHPQIYIDTPMVRDAYIDDGFIFPVGLIIEDSDSMIVGVHVNDHSSSLFRVRGMRKILDDVIAIDEKQTLEQNKEPRTGPPIGFMHKLVHDSVEKISGVKLAS